MIIKLFSLFFLVIVVSGCITGNSISVDEKIEFAKCLTKNDATMYGASWCSHCQKQKELFGDAFSYVNYVECTEDTVKCDTAGVKGYPTWIVDGKHLEGEQSFSTLSKLTGCKL